MYSDLTDKSTLLAAFILTRKTVFFKRLHSSTPEQWDDDTFRRNSKRASLRWAIQPWDRSQSCEVVGRPLSPSFPTIYSCAARQSYASARVTLAPGRHNARQEFSSWRCCVLPFQCASQWPLPRSSFVWKQCAECSWFPCQWHSILDNVPTYTESIVGR
jgi:hypothetical protein